jgi:hypothetical protein
MKKTLCRLILPAATGMLFPAFSLVAGTAPAWPPLIERDQTPGPLISFSDPSLWKTDGLKARFENGVLTLVGAGSLRLKAGVLTPENVAPFSRLLVDYFIEGGPVSDLGLVVKGFPQLGGQAGPRWGVVDMAWPTGRWVTCSYDLGFCEWMGGADAIFDPGAAALTFIHTPGSLTTAVRMRNPTFVRDAFRIKFDWVKPFEPLVPESNPDGTMRYTKTFTVESLSDKPVVIEASLDGSAPAFQPAIEPARFELPPHGRTSVTFTARSSVGMKPLQHDRVQVWFREPGKPESGQVRSFLLAAPAAPSGSRMAKPAMPYQPSVDGAMKRELRMPPGPAVWMGQSDLNRFAQMQEIAFDTFKDRATGEVITGTPHSSGALHRQIVDEIQCLAAAYACTGNKAYAKKVRDWFVLYAEKANDYPLALPLVEASSALCPNNATYVQASVIVGPMMKALFWVWPSDVFSPEDRRLIHRQFILVRAMESMKIHPGMTNMQDEINNMLFFAGLTTGDPNLIAEGLFGDHGVQAKIEKSFAPDGSTEESIAANYHGVVVGLVSTLVDAVLNAGIETDLNFDRLEKARRLLALLTMPDGRIPNRGDSPAPAGSVPDADRLPSLTFDEFGMSVLREGRGSNAVYVALDHRPPATTHSHPDKLSLILFGAGHVFGCDEGSLYNIDAGTSANVPDWPKRSAWGSHSLCHNTITVDRKSQHLGGGHRLYFQGDTDPVRAVGAWTDDVFDGVRFERHLALWNGILVVVDRLSSPAEHTYDLTHHSFGTVTSDVPMQPVASLGPEPMYNVPVDVKRGVVKSRGGGTVSWDQEGARMHYQVINVETQPLVLYTATGWANVGYQNVRQPAPFLMARQQGMNALFVSVVSFGVAPVKVGAVHVHPDQVEVRLPDGLIVFDFKAGKVSKK